MATVNFSVRMDADLKREVEAIYAELGMNLTSAVNAFLRQSVRVGSSPVEWCNRFVSFGVGYALSWSGVSSCWVGWGVSRDLVRTSRLR